MSSPPEIALLGFAPAVVGDRKPGIHGWARYRIGEYEVDGFVVHMNALGVYRLEFPAHIDRGGRRHPVLRHVDRRRDRELLARLLAALKRGGWLP